MSDQSYVADLSNKTSLRPSRLAIKRAALALAVALGIAGTADFGYGYLTTGRYLETTDDAYVKADSTIISPKVSGYIDTVLVGDNQPVKAGQLLARIDDRDFRTALEQAQADVAGSEAAVRNFDAQLALQQPIIEQGTADVAAAQANLKFAEEERARYDDLMKSGSGTIQRAQQTDAALREKTAQVQHGQSVAQQAALNLSYTEISAPVDGTVGARSLRVGQFVQAGTQLMAVVPLDAVYVVANFKETQLTYVRNGQPVEISIDGFRGTRLRGHVDSLSPASGLEFALLPPDNATGNFTKIVQRVPVKIALDDHRLAGLLRPGMSAEPTVDTKATVLAGRETQNRLASGAASVRANGS
jgi:membrane fusion protein, multidrug efflux system